MSAYLLERAETAERKVTELTALCGKLQGDLDRQVRRLRHIEVNRADLLSRFLHSEQQFAEQKAELESEKARANLAERQVQDLERELSAAKEMVEILKMQLGFTTLKEVA